MTAGLISAEPSATSIGFAAATIKGATPQTLIASFSVSDYSGSAAPTAAMHYGYDYSLGAVTCTVLTSTTETCNVGITFAPTLPGARKDALILSAGSTALATVLVHGIGDGPQAALNPGIETQVPFPGQYAYASTVGEDGAVYVVDQITPAIYRYTAAQGFTLLPWTLPSRPNTIAIDGAGTLYVGLNNYGKDIPTYSAAGVAGSVTVNPPAPYAPCQNSNGGTLEYLYAAAPDAEGDLFAVELLCQEIFELKADGSYVTTAISPAITQPTTIAVDDANDVFIGGYSINELTAAGQQSQINAVGAEDGLAVDASGILYATRYLLSSQPAVNFGAAELQPSNYATDSIGLEPGDAALPLGLGLGSSGTVYLGDYTSLDIIDRNAGAVTFSNATVGTTSAAQAVQMVNIGNTPLTVSSVGLTNVQAAGFSIVPVGGSASSPPTCANGLVLAPATYCQVFVASSPTHAGTLTGSVVFQTNSLNAVTSQSVALSATIPGPYVTVSPGSLAFGSHPIDAAITQYVALTNQGTENATLSAPSSSNAAFVASAPPACSNLASGASCMMSIAFKGASSGTFSGTITLSVTEEGVAFGTVTLPVTAIATGAAFDYQGGQAGYNVWRPATGYWYSNDGNGHTSATQWGAATDLPVVGDFDGDGKTDIAVWRPSTGFWYIIQSSNGVVVSKQWGVPNDLPVAGDFDGDGKTDLAVWRPSNGFWYIVQSSNGLVVSKQWGVSTDVPVAGDFDGDGKTDIAVWRPSTGFWYILQSSNGQVVSQQWGVSTDVTVTGDFDGDGKTDLAVWRPSTGFWYIIQSSNGQVVSKQWGQQGDVPVPRDYDGDGKTDIAVFRPSTGYWYVIDSSTGNAVSQQWGASSDVPVNNLQR